MDDDAADRLAVIAVELAQRVRTEDAPDNAAWLDTKIGAAEQRALIFIQAAAGPATAEQFRRAVAWAQPTDIDDIAVERACRGEDVKLNSNERRRVVEILARRGHLSDREIGERAGLDRRTVQRVRVRTGVRRRAA